MPAKAISKRSTESPHSRLVSVRLPGHVSKRLDGYARSMARSRGRSELIVQAIEDYLSWRIPQQDEVRAGIAAAERGELVDHAEIVAWIERTRAALRNRAVRAGETRADGATAKSPRPRKHAR